MKISELYVGVFAMTITPHGANHQNKGARSLILCCAVIYTALLAVTFPAASADILPNGVAVVAPTSVKVGAPFLVTIKSKLISNVKILNWRGKGTSLSGVKGTYRVLLGTDTENTKPCEATLRIGFKLKDKEYDIPVNITLKPAVFQKEQLLVDPDMVTPPASRLARIEREGKAAMQALLTNTKGNAPPLPLVSPVMGIYTSPYGKSRWFNGERKGRHTGVDMRAPVGTSVKATANGRVLLTGNFWFAGKCIYIDHGAGLVSFYCHLSKIKVKKGDNVKAGSVIALSGSTGRVTGPHLHFGLAWRGMWFDPAPLLKSR